MRCARHNEPNIAMARNRKTRRKRQSRRRALPQTKGGGTPIRKAPPQPCALTTSPHVRMRMRTCTTCLRPPGGQEDRTGRLCGSVHGTAGRVLRYHAKEKTDENGIRDGESPPPKPEGKTPTFQRHVRMCAPPREGAGRPASLGRTPNPPYETGPAVRDQTSHVQPRSPRGSPDPSPSGAAASILYPAGGSVEPAGLITLIIISDYSPRVV